MGLGAARLWHAQGKLPMLFAPSSTRALANLCCSCHPRLLSRSAAPHAHPCRASWRCRHWPALRHWPRSRWRSQSSHPLPPSSLMLPSWRPAATPATTDACAPGPASAGRRLRRWRAGSTAPGAFGAWGKLRHCGLHASTGGRPWPAAAVGGLPPHSSPPALLPPPAPRVGICCYVAGSLLALPAACMLPVEALRRRVRRARRQGWSCSAQHHHLHPHQPSLRIPAHPCPSLPAHPHRSLPSSSAGCAKSARRRLPPCCLCCCSRCWQKRRRPARRRLARLPSARG